MSDDQRRVDRNEQTNEKETPPVSRRQAMGAIGAAGFAGLAAASTSLSADHTDDGTTATGSVSVIPNPNFITNAR